MCSQVEDDRLHLKFLACEPPLVSSYSSNEQLGEHCWTSSVFCLINLKEILLTQNCGVLHAYMLTCLQDYWPETVMKRFEPATWIRVRI